MRRASVRVGEGAGLAVPNLGTYVSCLEPDAVAVAMDGAAAIGAPSIRVQVPRYDGSEPYVALRDAARRAFEGVVEQAARSGVAHARRDAHANDPAERECRVSRSAPASTLRTSA